MPMTARSIGHVGGVGPGLQRVGPQGDVQTRLQRGDGDVGERLAEPDDVEAAEQVGAGDAEQLLAAQPAQHQDAGLRVGGPARPPAARRPASALAPRGSSSASSARMRSASGVRVSREAMYWLEPSSWASRSATWPSSRSSRRYHWLPPSASLTWR